MIAGKGDEESLLCIGEAIDIAADLTARFLSDRTSVSAPAAYVLNRIDHGGPERLTTLATLEGVSQPSMTQLIQRMERHGLVSRRADADEGGWCWSVSPMRAARCSTSGATPVVGDLAIYCPS